MRIDLLVVFALTFLLLTEPCQGEAAEKFVKERSVELEKLPSNPDTFFPEDLHDKISYDGEQQRLIFVGAMSENEKEELMALSDDIEYKEAIETLFAEKSVELRELPSNPDTFFPEDLRDKIRYDKEQHRLIFVGAMSKNEKKELMALSGDTKYKRAIETLFKVSQHPEHYLHLIETETTLAAALIVIFTVLSVAGAAYFAPLDKLLDKGLKRLEDIATEREEVIEDDMLTVSLSPFSRSRINNWGMHMLMSEGGLLKKYVEGIRRRAEKKEEWCAVTFLPQYYIALLGATLFLCILFFALENIYEKLAFIRPIIYTCLAIVFGFAVALLYVLFDIEWNISRPLRKSQRRCDYLKYFAKLISL